MNRNTVILLLLLCVLLSRNVFAQPMRDTINCSNQPLLSWVKTAGGLDVDQINDITTDELGNIYIAGAYSLEMDFQSTNLLSNGFKDFFVAKLTPDGSLIWIQSGGGPQDDEAKGIAIDENGNVYVTGIFRGQADFGSDTPNSIGGTDVFVVKYNNNGVYQWGKFFGGFDDDYSNDICVDNQNNVAVTGIYYFAMSINGSSYISKGANDFFVVKFNSFGDLQWVTTHGSTINDSGVSLSCDNYGDFYVTGEFSGNLNFGSTVLSADGTKDVFLAKYLSSGTFGWAVKLGTVGNNDAAGSVACDYNNKVYVVYKADQVANQAQIGVYNAGGTNVNNFGFGGNGTIQPKGLTVDYSGYVYVSGMYSGTTDFGDGDVSVVGGSDYFVSKYQSDGTFAFKYIAGSNFLDCANSVCLDNENNIIVGGYCNNGIYFDGTPYSAEGKEDCLIVKYDSYFSFVDIATSSIMCDPGNLCVDVEVTGGTGAGTYDFYVDGVLTTSNICGLSVGAHQIIVTDDNDCFIETTIDLVAPTADPIDLPENISMCFHDTITLDAGPDYVNYAWSTSPEDIFQSIEVTDPGVYSVTVTDDFSCTTSKDVNVSELPDQDLFVNPLLYICPDESMTIQVLGYVEYLWFNGSQSTTYTADEGGDYWLQAYNGSCWYYDTLTIVEYPKPSVDLGGDVDICQGDSVLLDAGPDFVDYLWQDESQEQTYWAYETGPVSVVVTDINGCTATDAITVTLFQLADLELGSDTTMCSNDAFLLDPNVSGDDLTFLWSTGETSNTIEVTETNQYWIEVTNIAGCASYDTITVTIFPQPVLDLGEDISFCEGGSDTIRPAISYYSYEWGDGSSESYLYVDQSGIFYLTVTDENGCFDDDFIYVTESNLKPPFLGYDTTLCEGDEYILAPDSDYYSYLWQNGSHAGYQTVTMPGLYRLTVTDAIGCSASTSINIEYAEVPYIISVESGGGQIVIHAGGGTEPYQYSHDGDTWQQSNIYDKLPSDFYTMWVMDQNYCIVTIETFLDASVGIPSFFTPNGDGFNDYWVITGLYQYPDAVVKVFDRYGKLLYQFTGNEVGWNGNYMGLPLPSDTYWYSIKLVDDRKPLTGHVTIKR